MDIGAAEMQIANGQPILKNPFLTGSGASNRQFHFSFTNLAGGSFTVLSSTNLALPLNQWSNSGAAMETPPGSGQFQFTGPQATPASTFYRIRSP